MTNTTNHEAPIISHSKNLDFVRSFAVLLVVGRHVAGLIGYTHLGPVPLQFIGIFGVMLFFVLTAHVLMFSLEKISKTESGMRSIHRTFFIRRAFRIYPLSIFIVLVGFAVSKLFTFQGFAKISYADLVSNIFLVQNLTGARDIVGPLWSLPIEVQMYLLLPITYFLIARRNAWWIALTYGVGVALGIAALKIQLLGMLRYAPCFIPGIVAYWIIKRNPKRILPFFALPVALITLLVLYGKMGQFSQTLGGYPACIILGLMLPFVRESSGLLVNAICEAIAKYSYGIYLIHVPVMYACFLLDIPLLLQIALFIIVTWILSVLAYRYIESPMITLGSRLTKTAPQVVVAPSAA